MNKKVYIVGSAPLPNETLGIREAAGLRTHQFVHPLQKERHTIMLIAISNENGDTPIREEYSQDKKTRTFWISRHHTTLHSFIREKIKNFSPDVAIGVNTFPAYVLSTSLPQNIPFWADLNGWIMAEGQARGWNEDTNLLMANAFRQEKQILSKADKISTVSTPQKFAIIGELATLGLVRKENFHEEKVFALPNCTEIFEIDTKSEEKKDIPIFRGKKIPNDAFVVSWIGGYNNWVDEKTLFEALEKAMDTIPHLYFVSTGGSIKNIANVTFKRFMERINTSQHKAKFVFLGWIETSDMKKIYEESDMGINVDFLCIETETGARNRINEMMKFGLPIVTTGGSEIAETIGRYGAGITTPNGDSDRLCQSIVFLESIEKTERYKFRQSGQKISKEMFNADHIQHPVLQFVSHPKKTALPPLPLNSIFFFIKNTFLYLKKNGIKIFWAKIRQRIL